MSRYCKVCKHNVQEKHLYKEEQCPTCGCVLPKALELKAKRVKAEVKLYDILVEYTDRDTNEVKSIVKTDVTEEYYNKLKYTATNVVAVHTLAKEV
jgi:hypothetical protein